ncbi:putative phage tail assembly chaperone [Serratia proteamaculans]|uniref:Phage tail assembly chaperone n=1 Tax=Serratia proteamaculans TaxID=28151 RepID=A0ABS0TVK7_SERPR|nr:putative phage tail assembly chaperone [Serratia proteamaculans]MBI6182401.1 putative phage tail assembly chaperone [Serratia proteamaculans]
MNEKNTVTLTVNGQDISFEPSVTAYNKYVNEFMPNNKISPAINYLNRIVTADSKPALEAALKFAGAAMQIADAVNEQFAPQVEIAVKK